MKKAESAAEVESQARKLIKRYRFICFFEKMTRFSLRAIVERMMLNYERDAKAYNRRLEQWRREMRRVARVKSSKISN